MKKCALLFFVLSFFSVPQLHAVSLNRVLEDRIGQIKQTYVYAIADVEQAVVLVAALHPALPVEEDVLGSFNDQVVDMLQMLVALHPYERATYLELIEVYMHYQDQFEGNDEWFSTVRSFDPLFTSNNFDQRLKYFRRIPYEVYEGIESDPLSAFSFYSYYPLSPELNRYREYWTEMLESDSPAEFPAWSEYQGEVARIEVLNQRPDMDMVDEGLRLVVEGAFVVGQPRGRVLEHFTEHVPDVFLTVFPWDVEESTFTSDDWYQELNVVIKLTTKHKEGDKKGEFKFFPLDFVVTQGYEESDPELLYTLSVSPTSFDAALMSLMIDNWQISYSVKPHDEYSDFTQVSFKSELILNLEWAREKMKIDTKVKPRIDTLLPAQLAAFKEELQALPE